MKSYPLHALNPRSFDGWALQVSVEIDTVAPSFLSNILCASPLRRQAAFVSLAALKRVGPERLAARLRFLVATSGCLQHSPQQEIAQAITSTSRARELVRAVFGDVPDGLLGVFRRLGDNPLPNPAMYERLFDLFRHPDHRNRARALLQTTGHITPTRLEIVRRLDPLLLHPLVLKRLFSVSQAENANAALQMVRGTVSTATDEAIRQSVENMGEKTDLGDLFTRWLSKMDRPPVRPPVPYDDPDIAVMSSGEAMASLARRYRNCSATRVVYHAQGSEVLLEWLHPPGAIAQCHRLTSGDWVLTEIHAKGNGRVEPAMAAAVRRKLRSLGIPAFSPGEVYPRTNGVLSILGAWDRIGRNLGFDDDVEESLDELSREFDEIGDVA